LWRLRTGKLVTVSVVVALREPTVSALVTLAVLVRTV
jgi:hypothetical protein